MTYITKTQHDNAVKMTLGAVLSTKEGAAMNNTAIANAVGTSRWAVARCRKTLRDCGLLGRSAAGSAFNVPRVPDPTWVDFYKRVTGFHDWIAAEDSFGLVQVPAAIHQEVEHLLDLLHTEGSLQGIGYTLFKSRLERIEKWSDTAQSEVPDSEYVALFEEQTATA